MDGADDALRGALWPGPAMCGTGGPGRPTVYEAIAPAGREDAIAPARPGPIRALVGLDDSPALSTLALPEVPVRACTCAPEPVPFPEAGGISEYTVLKGGGGDRRAGTTPGSAGEGLHAHDPRT